MKTSFYFVLWILIYPILGLFNSTFIDDNAFIIALVIVMAISWLLKKIMPNILSYERACQVTPILEDVYTDNVTSFKKRLSRDAIIETITAVYFIITTFVIILAIVTLGVTDWIALIVFGFFSIGSISRSASLLGAKFKLKSNPSSEQCMEIADDTYDLDYATYYEAHNGVSYNDMLPPKPKYFKAFKIFSLVIAAIAMLLGLPYIVLGIILMLAQTSIFSAAAGMFFLYGSLATYFGVKDFITCIQKHNRNNTVSMKENSDYANLQ